MPPPITRTSRFTRLVSFRVQDGTRSDAPVRVALRVKIRNMRDYGGSIRGDLPEGTGPSGTGPKECFNASATKTMEHHEAKKPEGTGRLQIRLRRQRIKTQCGDYTAFLDEINRERALRSEIGIRCRSPASTVPVSAQSAWRPPSLFPRSAHLPDCQSTSCYYSITVVVKSCALPRGMHTIPFRRSPPFLMPRGMRDVHSFPAVTHSF